LLQEEGLIEIVEGKDIEKVKEPEDVKITGISMAKVEEKTSEFTVESTNEKGEEVKEGQLVGPLGGTGGDWLPHLHFEIRLVERANF